jgi:hypothetical protein
MGVTAIVGVIGVLQSVLALGLLPLGVKLLMRDAKACGRLRARARFNAGVSAAMLGVAGALGWAVANVPGFVHPWLAAALGWTALRPVLVYGAACLVHALVLGQCTDGDK